MIGMFCFMGYIIITLIIAYISIRLILWLLLRIYHWQHPEIPKLKRRLLKGFFKQKYGKREGKHLYKKMKMALYERFKIR